MRPPLRPILPPPAPPPAFVYHSLDHWRGFAALSVLFFHAVGTGKPAHPLVAALQVPARFGWLGVHIFFVVSGYCIAANVQSLRARGIGAGGFLRDRLWRILPTYWAACGVTLTLALAAGRFTHAPPDAQPPGSARFWLGNLLLLQPYLGTGYYVIVYWTLPIELGFYGLVGMLHAVPDRLRRWTVGLALALALGSLWLPPEEALGVLTCWPEFACGLLVYHAVSAAEGGDTVWRNACLGLIGLLGVVGSVATHHVLPLVHTDQQAPFSAAFALGLYALYPLDDRIRRAASLRWLGLCGVFSFSLYLMHYPLLAKASGVARRFCPDDSPFQAGVIVLCCLAAVLGSYLFYVQCEKRFERWRRHFKGHPVRV